MDKRFFIAWGAVFIGWMVGSFLVHGLLLNDGYAQLPHLFRPQAEAQQYFLLMLAAHLVMAGAFVWIYQRGHEPKPWLPQGIRFGIAVALLGPVPMYTIYYVVQPLPGGFVAMQIIYDSLLVVLLGVLTAFLSRTTVTEY